MELYGSLKNDILEKLYAFCAYQERCTQDIKKKLLKLSIEETYHAEYIAHLEQERFLDEERFVRFFVKSKLKGNKWGRRKIQFSLRQKGVADSLIDLVLDEMDDVEVETIVFELAQKKNRSLKETDLWKRKQKIFAYLAQKGFQSSEIKGAIEKLEF